MKRIEDIELIGNLLSARETHLTNSNLLPVIVERFDQVYT